KIDGSYLEGGGQIIRTALALSTLTGIPFEAINIRKGRKQSGLKAQHLHCIKALQQLCNAKAEHATLASEKLIYHPEKIKAKEINIDIGTAGSISLLLQSILLPSFFANKTTKIILTGGTSGKWAMPYDFFAQVLIPQLRKFCKKLEVKLIKRGYYPAGGGKIEISITPEYKLLNFKNFNEFQNHLKESTPKLNLIEQGNLIQIKGISHASTKLQKANVAERQANATKLILNNLNCPVNIQTEYAETLSPGSGITLWAIFSKDKEEIDFNNPIRLGSDSLGEKGKPAEKVGKEAANKLIKEINSNSPIDSHTADSLIPWLALFGRQIKVSEITPHSRTNIWTCEQFLGKIFKINKKENIISII
ncbi:RNA 3'-terminal phosphate cyclase, partial [Candidatus Woesearchaeota archaeon]|nr:RNA 3'-terminal phosphate cyclase [Candidatus Woesearchaeota archaeon]